MLAGFGIFHSIQVIRIGFILRGWFQLKIFNSKLKMLVKG